MLSGSLKEGQPRRIAVIGCGHVGLVLAVGLARLGHRVVGQDRNASVVMGLSRGIPPFHEAELEDLLGEVLASGRVSFTASAEGVMSGADFVFLAVDTPPSADNGPDLTNLRAAVRTIGESLHEAQPLVVVKSTVPVGTGTLVEDLLAESTAARHIRVLSNPEFLRQGTAVYDFFHPDRTIIGAADPADGQAVAELFAELPGERVMVDVPTAEMIKYASNAFLATRVSFVNEIATMCDALGVDVDGVVEGMGYDPRIGHAFMRPGIGYGGSCLPKDVAAARYIAGVHGVATPLLAAVESVNADQPARAVRRLAAQLGGLKGATVGVWGATFKGGTDDARRSPAMDVVALLVRAGTRVHIYEPSGAFGLPEHLRGALRSDPYAAVADADALAVLADWAEFATFDLKRVRQAMRGDLILDARNVLDPAHARLAGFRYIGMGRGSVSGGAVRTLEGRQALRHVPRAVERAEAADRAGEEDSYRRRVSGAADRPPLTGRRRQA